MITRPVIFGLKGQQLSVEEKAFFREVRPYGFILFARNIESKAQVRALTDALRDLGGDAQMPILIDQEGGRVARLRPPVWRPCPAAERFHQLCKAGEVTEQAIRATYLNARLIGRELMEIGVNVDCAPMLDIRFPGAHDIVGDRAFGSDPETVIALGRAMAEGLKDEGVMPIIKHIPGHGRAMVDSHESLPVVQASLPELEKMDFVPFTALKTIPWAMTAHITYTAIDDKPATLSPKTVQLIRQQIGFKGLLLTDDLSMKALTGTFGERTRASLEAGCDIALHCNGDMAEMQPIAEALPDAMPQATAQRIAAANAWLKRAGNAAESGAMEQELAGLLQHATVA